MWQPPNSPRIQFCRSKQSPYAGLIFKKITALNSLHTIRGIEEYNSSSRLSQIGSLSSPGLEHIKPTINRHEEKTHLKKIHSSQACISWFTNISEPPIALPDLTTSVAFVVDNVVIMRLPEDVGLQEPPEATFHIHKEYDCPYKTLKYLLSPPQ